MDDWPDPNPDFGVSLDDLDKRFDEVIQELTELRIELEERRWFYWGITIALVLILWKVWR